MPIVEEARAKGLKRSYLDRLMLNEGRIRQMAEGLRQTAALPDPICQGDYSTIRPNGLEIRRVRVPLDIISVEPDNAPAYAGDTRTADLLLFAQAQADDRVVAFGSFFVAAAALEVLGSGG